MFSSCLVHPVPVSFLWGSIVFGDPVKDWILALLSILVIIIGTSGMTWASSPSAKKTPRPDHSKQLRSASADSAHSVNAYHIPRTLLVCCVLLRRWPSLMWCPTHLSCMTRSHTPFLPSCSPIPLFDSFCLFCFCFQRPMTPPHPSTMSEPSSSTAMLSLLPPLPPVHRGTTAALVPSWVACGAGWWGCWRLLPRVPSPGRCMCRCTTRVTYVFCCCVLCVWPVVR